MQAALEHGRWFGRPDVLIRIDRPSRNLGAWSYEAADAKLARETRGGTILQLGLYCEMLEALQGLAPDKFHVVTPGEDAVDGTEARPIVRTYRDLYPFTVDPATGRFTPPRPMVACSILGLEPQGEGLTWRDARSLWVTSERGMLKSGMVGVAACGR